MTYLNPDPVVLRLYFNERMHQYILKQAGSATDKAMTDLMDADGTAALGIADIGTGAGKDVTVPPGSSAPSALAREEMWGTIQKGWKGLLDHPSGILVPGGALLAFLLAGKQASIPQRLVAAGIGGLLGYFGHRVLQDEDYTGGGSTSSDSSDSLTWVPQSAKDWRNAGIVAGGGGLALAGAGAAIRKKWKEMGAITNANNAEAAYHNARTAYHNARTAALSSRSRNVGTGAALAEEQARGLQNIVSQGADSAGMAGTVVKKPLWDQFSDFMASRASRRGAERVVTNAAADTAEQTAKSGFVKKLTSLFKRAPRRTVVKGTETTLPLAARVFLNWLKR